MFSLADFLSFESGRINLLISAALAPSRIEGLYRLLFPPEIDKSLQLHKVIIAGRGIANFSCELLF
jgi:hypothetical protein